MSLVDTCLIPFGLATLAFVAFLPSLTNEFVDWDDLVLFTRNTNYRGLGPSQIHWMFTTTLMGHWVPLTWLTHGLDYVLWGLNPFGYHLVNLLLHAANTVLLYLVVRRLLAKATTFSETARRLGAVVAALFFALHPLRVESVAWATERRDVLSGFFYLLTVLTYLATVDASGRRRTFLRVSSVVFYVLAFMAKSMVMTLPFVLVLLDMYPLRRLPVDPRSWRVPEAKAVWREKIPYGVIALVGGAVAYYAQSQFFTSSHRLGWTARPWIVLHSFWFYVAKTAVPFGLSPLYELPLVIAPSQPRFLLAAIGVLVITIIVLALRRRWPAGLALWTYYVIVLGPVAGLTHAGFQLAHDRYTYLPCLGWAVLAGGAFGAAVEWWRAGKLRPPFATAIVTATIVGFAGLAMLTWQQTEIWRTTEDLWRYAVENEPACAICQNNLGVLLYNEGHHALARGYLETAIKLRPDRDKGQKDLGLTLMSLGLNAEAIAHFRRAVELAPSDVEIRNDLGVALLRERHYREALAHLEFALTIKPDDVMVLTNVGQVNVNTGRPERGIGYLERAVKIDPMSTRGHIGLGLAYVALGNLDAARREYAIVSSLDRREASLLGPALLLEW